MKAHSHGDGVQRLAMAENPTSALMQLIPVKSDVSMQLKLKSQEQKHANTTHTQMLSEMVYS